MAQKLTHMKQIGVYIYISVWLSFYIWITFVQQSQIQAWFKAQFHI